MCSARVLAISLAMLIAGVTAPAGASILITVDKSTQQMTVTVDGATRWTWPVSTGRPGYDTPSGRFTAFRMEADHFSKEWDDAPMPHSIFFTPKGHAIHGSFETRHLGGPASHGCVRLSPGNAAKLYALVEEQGLPNTKVVLTGDVREASARRGSPRNRDAEEIGAADEPAGRSVARPYGYAPRNDYGQPAYGYRGSASPYAPFSPPPYQYRYGY
jgi:hypothetical protein